MTGETNGQILVIDTETSSLVPHQADILELALAMVDLHSGKVELLIDTLVQPEASAAEWEDCWFMRRHSGLQAEAFIEAQRFQDVAPELQRMVASLPVTAYNLHFDASVLKCHGISLPKRYPCLMLTCKDILQLPGRYDDWKFPSFGEAWRYFFPEEPFIEKHRAGYDVVHEARLAFELVQRGYLPKQGGLAVG